MTDVIALARFFASERAVAVPDDPATARRVLRALLTARHPAPIPPEIAASLDELLCSETAERETTDAAALPTLADSGTAGGRFGERVRLWRGDLTRLRADGIVNAANAQMLGCFIPGHACIDNAIHDVAGPGLRAECARHMTAQGHGEPTGAATVTGGYHLPARYVFHTVGPIVSSELPSAQDAAALASCYRSILDAADALGDVRTLGFCAISTGVFGYPKDAGAVVAVAAVRDWLDEHPDSLVEPLFSAFTPADEDFYLAAIGQEVPR